MSHSILRSLDTLFHAILFLLHNNSYMRMSALFQASTSHQHLSCCIVYHHCLGQAHQGKRLKVYLVIFSCVPMFVHHFSVFLIYTICNYSCNMFTFCSYWTIFKLQINLRIQKSKQKRQWEKTFTKPKTTLRLFSFLATLQSGDKVWEVPVIIFKYFQFAKIIWIKGIFSNKLSYIDRRRILVDSSS